MQYVPLIGVVRLLGRYSRVLLKQLITSWAQKYLFSSEVFTIDSGFQDGQNRKSASFSFNPKERKTSLSGNGVVATLDECKGANGTATGNQKTNLRKRRMSINHYKKEKSVVVILVLVSVMFAFATIPSGIVRILAIQYKNSDKNTGYEVIWKDFLRTLKIQKFCRCLKWWQICWNSLTPPLISTCIAYVIRKYEVKQPKFYVQLFASGKVKSQVMPFQNPLIRKNDSWKKGHQIKNVYLYSLLCNGPNYVVK